MILKKIHNYSYFIGKTEKFEDIHNIHNIDLNDFYFIKVLNRIRFVDKNDFLQMKYSCFILLNKNENINYDDILSFINFIDKNNIRIKYLNNLNICKYKLKIECLKPII
jgi:hypothetical protein